MLVSRSSQKPVIDLGVCPARPITNSFPVNGLAKQGRRPGHREGPRLNVVSFPRNALNIASDALAADFQCVGQATVADGSPKYSRRTSARLVGLIVSRSYGQAILDLCHLINVAHACGHQPDSHVSFFFDNGRAVPASFRTWIDKTLETDGWSRPGFNRIETGVSIDYAQRTVTLHFSRMPVLSMLMEFLITALSFVEIDNCVGEMLANPPKEAIVKRTANAIEKRLYNYLSQHLPSAQQQGKFNVILNYLQAQQTGNMLDIDDKAILEFWRAYSDRPVPRGDFRLFRTVLRDFINFVRSLDLAESRDAVNGAVPLDDNREAHGDQHPVSASVAGAIGQWCSPLDQLAELCAADITFLSRREAESLSLLLECGPLADRFPLSILRSETFGKSQSRIVQALRTGIDEDRLKELVGLQDVENYGQRQSALKSNNALIRQLLKAAAYVLLNNLNADRIEHSSATHMAQLLSSSDQQVDKTSALQSDRLDDLLAEGKQVYERLARKRFGGIRPDDPSLVERFKAGSGLLIQIVVQIDGYLDRLERLNQGTCDLDRWYGDDLDIFREQLRTIYRGRQNGSTLQSADRGTVETGTTII